MQKKIQVYEGAYFLKGKKPESCSPVNGSNVIQQGKIMFASSGNAIKRQHCK